MTARRLTIILLAAAMLPFFMTVRADVAASTSSLYELEPDERPIAVNLKGAIWFDTEWALIVMPDTESAREAAAGLRAAISAFYTYFGVAPSRGAVLHPHYAALYARLAQTGTGWFIPWTFGVPSTVSQSDPMARLAARLVEQGLAEPLAGLPIALRQAADATASAAIPPDDNHHLERRSAFRHEVAHALFLANVMPNTRKGQYASDAPDWLDEAAALIAETPEVTAIRRRQFLDQIREDRVPPLSTMLISIHPVLASSIVQEALSKARDGSPSAPVLLEFRVADIGLDRKSIVAFYAQSRAIVDYLVARTGRPRVLAGIAASIRLTGDPLAWVGDLPMRGSLPGTVAELDADFRAWCEGLVRDTPP